jgi:hypothetical protein
MKFKFNFNAEQTQRKSNKLFRGLGEPKNGGCYSRVCSATISKHTGTIQLDTSYKDAKTGGSDRSEVISRTRWGVRIMCQRGPRPRWGHLIFQALECQCQPLIGRGYLPTHLAPFWLAFRT